ncbi:MAG: hypothetical protein LBC03_07180 [Nitrososphaerota archaeon]|nr:hypothetical protein [Nitrososphaerota archaeon]
MFAKQIIKGIETPDEILSSYTEPLQNWLSLLCTRVEQAEADFAQFVQVSHFNQSVPLKENSHRGLLAAILRDYEDIENRIAIELDTFLPLISVWNNQKRSSETRLHHDLLKTFVSDVLKLGNINGYIMTIVGEGYACLPIKWDERKHVIFGTYSEMKNLQKSVLLAHEIGHVFYHKNENEIASNITSKVLRQLIESMPLNVDQTVFERARYIWAQHWIPEFVSDCFAVRLMGPAFLLQFMLLAINSQPNSINSTHPPSNLRVKFMVDTLQSLNLSNSNIGHYQALWDSYAHSVSVPNSVFLVDEEVTKTAFDSINSVMLPTCVDEKWVEILEAKKTIEANMVPTADLVSNICALAMVEEHNKGDVDLAMISQALLKRYAHDSNVF